MSQLSTTTNRVFLELALDWRVLGFTTGVAVVTSIVFGTAPALRGTRVQPNDALKAQGRSIVGDGRFSLGNLLVIAQVALSLMLVVAAGLFVRTFSSLARLDLGVDGRPVLIASVNTQRLQLEVSDRAALFQRLRKAAEGVPGVESAATSAITPVQGMMWNDVVQIPGGPPLPERDRTTYINVVSPRWFHTFGTRLLAGRDIAETDTRALSARRDGERGFCAQVPQRQESGWPARRAGFVSESSERRSRDRRLRGRRRLQLSARAGAADDVHSDSAGGRSINHVDQRARCGRIACASHAEPGGGADGRERRHRSDAPADARIR